MMKYLRKFAILFAAVMLFSSFSVFAEYDLNAYPYDESREEWWVQAKAYNATPTLDASITEGEGWSEAVTFDHKNMLPLWAVQSRCIISADVRYAWDDNGIYIAADITDDTMITTTGEDDTDGINDYGWNGDTFIFALDPMMQFRNEGFAVRNWNSAWYCFSVREDGKLMCYATQTSPSGDITNKIEGKGIVTDGGWAFEAMIPWERLIADTEAVTNGVITFTKDDITELGTVSRAGFIYMNRAIFTEETEVFFYSYTTAEKGDILTLSRDVCIPVHHDDGMSYYDGGVSARSYGIELTMADSTGYAPERTTDMPAYEEEETADAVELPEEPEVSDSDDDFVAEPPTFDADTAFESDISVSHETKKKKTEKDDDGDEPEEDDITSDDSSINDTVIIISAAAIIVISGVIIAVITAKKIKND